MLGNCEATFCADSHQIPLSASPTHEKFLSARDMVSRLATKSQFVAFVVATHAAPTTQVAALKQQQDGVIADTDCLTIEDFRLANCAARTRLVLIDAQDRVKSDPHAPGGSINPYPQIQQILVDGADSTSVVITSSDGKRPSGIKRDRNESLFLWQFFQDSSKSLEISTFGSLFKKVNTNFESAFDDALDPAPQGALYPPAAQDLAMRVAFNMIQAKQDTTLKPISAEEIAMEPIPSFGHLARGGIFVQREQPPLFEVTADNQGALQKRGKTVTAGLKALVTHPGLTVADLKQIGVGRVGQYVVVTLPKKVKRPDGANYLVTADSEMASIKNCDPKQLAATIAHQVRVLMDQQYATTAAIDPPTDEDLYNKGLLYLIQKNYSGAEQSFASAVDLSPGYVEAYLHLAETYLMDKKKVDAKLVLDSLDKKIQRQTVQISPMQKARATELKSAVK
jgi:hypothetical protein